MCPRKTFKQQDTEKLKEIIEGYKNELEQQYTEINAKIQESEKRIKEEQENARRNRGYSTMSLTQFAFMQGKNPQPGKKKITQEELSAKYTETVNYFKDLLENDINFDEIEEKIEESIQKIVDLNLSISSFLPESSIQTTVDKNKHTQVMRDRRNRNKATEFFGDLLAHLDQAMHALRETVRQFLNPKAQQRLGP